MNRILCIAAIVAVAAPAMAQDRYGPDSSGNRGTFAAAVAGGRVLTWAGKVQPAQIRPVVAVAPPHNPLANGMLRNTSAIVPGQGTQPAPAPPQPQAQPAPQPVAENAPWRRLTGGGQSAPAAQPTTPVQAQGPLPPAAPAGLAAPNADYKTDISAKATPTPQGEQAKFYSLHRDYGDTPDPITMPEKSQVFLAGGPGSPRLDEQDDTVNGAGVGADDDTGKTAAEKKKAVQTAQANQADWTASDNQPPVQRVTITRP